MPFNVYEQAGSVTPPDTAPNVLVSAPVATENKLVQSIKIANLTAINQVASLFYDPTGTGTGDDKALLKETIIEPGIPFDMDFGGVGLPLIGAGTISVQCGNPDAIIARSWARRTDQLAGKNFKSLFQILPGDSLVNLAYTMGDQGIEHTSFKALVICNLNGADCKYSIYANPSGSSFTDLHKVKNNIPLGANCTDIWIEPGEGLLLNNVNGSIGVQGDTPNCINFTGLGIEHGA